MRCVGLFVNSPLCSTDGRYPSSAGTTLPVAAASQHVLKSSSGMFFKIVVTIQNWLLSHIILESACRFLEKWLAGILIEMAFNQCIILEKNNLKIVSLSINDYFLSILALYMFF